MAWATSNRAVRLPSNWRTLRARVLRRHPECQLGYVGCTHTSTQVDHIIHGDDHSSENLQGVCGYCHAVKSSAEGHAAKPSRRRDTEQHPGVIQ